ncbi:hypothetical protein DP113_23565 [Brasilonema octagenarum UFV-E1]|uniref:Uncharacterized protein n=1 Tax=Brasilonema sennae CENA114 TaxID=415709 RepID=A0A856MJZ5_9CYAN|nr:hypothetical protein [Brasilonema sennae]QDL10490.1 hypothetical protein DP114_23660 [Brasilonema sennae CENA114]QDL16836.1 hypothetical protein DP113_23565 [Brasilonema octagenarum UFV-E1]
MKIAPLEKGIVHEIIAQSKEIIAQSKEIKAQSKEIKAQSKEIKAQSKEIKAQSKEVKAQSKEVKAQSKEVKAQSKEVKAQSDEVIAQSKEVIAQSKNIKAQSKFIQKISNDLKEVNIEAVCQFIALKTHLARVKIHQEQIETAILIKWGKLEQLPLSSRYTNWLTENGYHWQPIFVNAASQEIQYEFKIFACDYEAFALLSKLQSERRLYYAIPDFDTALQIINTIKDSCQIN